MSIALTTVVDADAIVNLTIVVVTAGVLRIGSSFCHQSNLDLSNVENDVRLRLSFGNRTVSHTLSYR
jgi:hypothetical protein